MTVRRHSLPELTAARMQRGQHGIALILVLWLTIMLTVIASGFAFSMRNEALSARNALSLARARAVANGAIERMAFELSRPRYPTAWASDGEPRKWREDDVEVVATAVDESAKIDINAAPDTLLKGLLEQLAGTDSQTTAKIVDAILDWRDPDDITRPNGAEEAAYRQAGLQQKPANAPFETVSELARVMGVTPAVYARIADSLTVHSRQPGINALTASRDVLLALPNATPATVDAYMLQRMDARAAKLPVPPFPAASGFAAGAVPVWRIRAEATTPDGVTFAREAVVRPSGDARRPLLTLSWQDGTMAVAAAAAAATAAAAAAAGAGGTPATAAFANDQSEKKRENGRP
jgi:general secretion pathway protein K